MAYSKEAKAKVISAIERLTGEHLDRYIQDSIIKVANKAMEEKDSAIQVADAVYDYMYEKVQDNIVIDTACQQCIPKNVTILLRHEIINALK